jgi:hypothetical protein
MDEVPSHVIGRLKDAHFRGYLASSLDHWMGALAGAGIVGQETIDELYRLRGEITGKYQADAAVLDKIKSVIGSLRPRKR